MQGIAKRGLALAAAATGLVMGSAAVASADAIANGATYHSGGFVSGNAVDTAANVPVNVCGNQITAVTVHDYDGSSYCANADAPSGAVADGATAHSGGFLSGNTVNTAANVPLNVTGNQAGLIGVHNVDRGSFSTNG